MRGFEIEIEGTCGRILGLAKSHDGGREYEGTLPGASYHEEGPFHTAEIVRTVPLDDLPPPLHADHQDAKDRGQTAVGAEGENPRQACLR